MLVERGRHPRFAIGESSTPLANLLLEELADRYDLPRIRAFSKWGAVAAGASGRGVRPEARVHVLLPSARRRVRRRRRSRAAAAGGREPARRDCRHALVPAGLRSRARARRRRAEGAIYLDMTRLERIRHEGGLHDPRRGARRPARPDHRGIRDRRQRARAGSCIARSACDEAPRRWLPPTQGLYTHFEGVERWDRVAAAAGAAALSDRRCGGASRVSRRMDLGAAVQQRHHERRRRVDRSGRRPRSAPPTARPAWDRLLATLPSVADQFRSRAPCCRSSTRRAWRSAARAWQGRAWALLPSAAGVIDPLLSTGFPLTLLGILRLLDLLERTSPGRERDAALPTYERDDAGRAGRDRTARRRAVRDDGRSAALQAAQPAVFRRRQLQRGGAPARAARTGARVPALRASDVRSGAGGVCALAAVGAATGRRGRRSKRASIARSSRSTRPACSIAAAATGIPCSRRISWRPRPS